MIKAIKGYSGYYASDNGDIWSVKRGAPRRLIPQLDHKGYEQIKLSYNGKSKTFKVHRIIASTFIPNPENKPQVNHIDENKRNNNMNNLEWCTCLENIRHGTGIARSAKSRRGLRVDNSKALEAWRKPIVQYDKDGNFIKEWSSATEAGDALNIGSSHITSCCRHKRLSTGGFKWEYARENITR